MLPSGPIVGGGGSWMGGLAEAAAEGGTREGEEELQGTAASGVADPVVLFSEESCLESESSLICSALFTFRGDGEDGLEEVEAPEGKSLGESFSSFLPVAFSASAAVYSFCSSGLSWITFGSPVFSYSSRLSIVDGGFAKL